MDINLFERVEEARALLTGDKDRIITRLPVAHVLQQASRLKAGAFDFCQTLSLGNQWLEILPYLRADLRAIEDTDRDWYLDHANGHGQETVTLDHPDWFVENRVKANRAVVEAAWLARSLQHFKESALARSDFERVGRDMCLRDGARELLNLFDYRVVISMGVEQIIAAALSTNNLHAAIVATRLTFNMFDCMNGYHPNVVVSSTKGVAQSRFVELSGVPVEEHLVVGDSFFDIEMMPERAFNVWIVPHVDIHQGIMRHRDAHFEDMLRRATIVLYSNSLRPLVDLIMTARKQYASV